MTTRDFLTQYRMLRKKGWSTEEVGGQLRLRPKKGSNLHCPITAVCASLHKGTFAAIEFRKAGHLLKLNDKQIDKIATASDPLIPKSKRKPDHDLRKTLRAF